MRVASRIPASLGLFAINALICGPLFTTEYLDAFRTNEGTFITFARFLRESWPHVGWFPWFNAGMPIENTYLPLVPALTAALSFAARCSPAHAFHFLAAAAYALSPVFLFLLAARISGRLAPAFWAALAWSLLSPSVVIPRLMEDLHLRWVPRRLTNIVYWGETPHAVALCLLLLALLLLARYLDAPSARRWAAVVVTVAAVMLSNAFGIVVAGLAMLMLFASRDRLGWRRLLAVAAILPASYLLVCRFLPPSLLRLMAVNAQTEGGDYRFTLRSRLMAALFLLALAALWAATRRLRDPMLRFAVLFFAGFAAITATWILPALHFLPQPHRYHLEMEIGACLLAAFALEPVARRLPRNGRLAAAAIALALLAWAGIADYRIARRLIRPADLAHASVVRHARWIAANLPGQRVLVAGQNGWWFNLFADNPQLGSGHEPSAPNWMQRVAVFTILSGMNAGAEDGAIATFWLKAYGCGAIVVPEPGGDDVYQPVANPRKFDGLLTLRRRDPDDSIYQVPLRSASLAHVIPASAVVRRRPIHGLDLDPARAYVAALDDPALPLAALHWDNPERGHIAARLVPQQVVSVQVTYDPRWHAAIAGRPQTVYGDELGLIVIEPQCVGDCAIDLSFNRTPWSTSRPQ